MTIKSKINKAGKEKSNQNGRDLTVDDRRPASRRRALMS